MSQARVEDLLVGLYTVMLIDWSYKHSTAEVLNTAREFGGTLSSKISEIQCELNEARKRNIKVIHTRTGGHCLSMDQSLKCHNMHRNCKQRNEKNAEKTDRCAPPSFIRSLLRAWVQPTLDPSAETFMAVQCASPGRGGELVNV